MSWLEEHIETFVEPVLGADFDRSPTGHFTANEMTVIKNAWRSVKKSANGKPILLPGRDVFVFEILAQREKYPTLFVPECSRMTVRHVKIPNLHDYYMFDTGFAGSIPRALFGLVEFAVSNPQFRLLSSSNNGYNGDNRFTTQVFPRLSFSRGLALKIESTPKYWESGRMADDGVPVQWYSAEFEFAQAARLTIEIYTDSSAKFVNHHRPMQERRW